MMHRGRREICLYDEWLSDGESLWLGRFDNDNWFPCQNKHEKQTLYSQLKYFVFADRRVDKTEAFSVSPRDSMNN